MACPNCGSDEVCYVDEIDCWANFPDWLHCVECGCEWDEWEALEDEDTGARDGIIPFNNIPNKKKHPPTLLDI
jgi:hypothetical protein